MQYLGRNYDITVLSNHDRIYLLNGNYGGVNAYLLDNLWIASQSFDNHYVYISLIFV